MSPVRRPARLLALIAASVIAAICSAQTPGTPSSDPVAAEAHGSPTGNHPGDEGRKTVQFGSVALSPDAQTVAWTLRGEDAHSIHLTPGAGGGNDQQITVEAGTNCEYRDPVWSPKGDTLAFLASCGADSADPTVPRQSQIYLWSRTGGAPHQLTHLTGDLNQLAWSPDSRSLAFLFVQNATRTAGALDAMKPWAGVIGEDNVEVQRVYAVRADTGEGAFATPANLHVYEFDFAPRAHEIAFIAAAPPGENNWWVAKLYRTEVREGAETPAVPAVVLDPGTVTGALHGLQIAVPRWSPDGQQIAFVGGLMSDQGSTGGDLYTVARSGGQPTDITPQIDGTPTFETWISDHTLGFVEDRRGHMLLNAYNVSDRSPAAGGPLDLGEVSLSGGQIVDAISVSDRLHGSKDRTAAFVLQGFSKAPEIYLQTGAGAPQQLTHLNDGLQPVTRTESVEWTNGPFHVQGWLTFPANYDPHQHYPLIVQVHGGPSAAITARWITHGTAIDWASHGYFEFQPNPRGSFGQGEAFTEANRKDFGYGDLRDILAGMDMLEAKYPIDKTREGLTGWSYGGFMTMFAVTQTHRFRAAVAGAGLSDWLSYYGENSIDQWMIPFFGASVYDDPAVYAKSSPITFIKNVRTTTLVIVGDRDGECPAPQSFEFWHALRDLGVKTELVVYPDEGHGFRDPKHIADRNARTLRWFADNMPSSASAVPAP